jgi:hypothetical protein
VIVYFDTVRRKRPVEEGGELVKLDWSAKKIIKTVPLFPSDPDIESDPNPRGNSRGGKGIIISGDEIFAGTYHSILVFDPDLNLKRRITSNLFVNIHELCFAGKYIWVSSTTIDCAVKVTRDGKTVKTWWPREEPALQQKFGLTPMDIDKSADNRLRYIDAELSTKQSHTHLNSVITWGDHTYVLLNKMGALIQIEPALKVVLEDPLLKGAHSPAITGDGSRFILCSSFNHALLIYDRMRGNMIKKIELLDFKEIKHLQQQSPDQPFNKSIFVRGLELVDNGRVLAGIAPAGILEIDTEKNRLLDFYQYSSEVGDAVHGLAHIPNQAC